MSRENAHGRDIESPTRFDAGLSAMRLERTRAATQQFVETKPVDHPASSRFTNMSL
jgi:hypothetical protein